MRGHGLRRALVVGALLTVLGLAIGGTLPVVRGEGSSATLARQLGGGILTLVGWAVVAWGVHRIGREAG